MASLLVDPAPTAAPENATAGGNAPASPDGPPSQPSAGAVPAQAPGPGVCGRCGAAMTPGQDWCLQCGAGAPGSIGTPSWRSAATVLILTAVLALGAAAAAYAALSKGTPPTHMVTTTVAQAAPPSGTASTPTPTTKAGETPGALTPLPLPKIKTPKIPVTPTVTPTTSTPAESTPTNTGSTPTNTTSTGSEAAPPESNAIVLDTNAAETYNPYNYPAANFGDPSLAIDGDSSTAWSAQVNPASAPLMADGVLIDLKAHQKVAEMELITSTPGMTVQVYGTSGHTAPTTITDPAWIALDGPRVTKKTHVKIKLHDSSKEFYYVLLWISKAPSTSTPANPGHVSVNEIELFPPE